MAAAPLYIRETTNKTVSVAISGATGVADPDRFAVIP